MTRGTASAPNIDVATATGPVRVVVIVRKLSLDRIGCAVRCALVGRHAPIGQGADPAVKSGNYVTNIVGLAEAKRRGADDCIFVDGTGHVTEASTANLYAVLDGTVCTAPVGSGLLAGITRRLLIDCATALGLPIVERPIAREELTRADEAFLSGTVRDLSPITHIDGRELSGGSGGPITQRLQREFAAFCDRRSIEDRGALRDAVSRPDRRGRASAIRGFRRPRGCTGLRGLCPGGRDWRDEVSYGPVPPGHDGRPPGQGLQGHSRRLRPPIPLHGADHRSATLHADGDARPLGARNPSQASSSRISRILSIARR